MISLRRKNKEETTDIVVVDKDGGKGRPTPTRKEAVASRPVQPYLRTKATPGTTARTGSRKEARAASRAQFERQRAALKAGDQANLPVRDKGPERAFVRDLVDARAGGVLSIVPVVAIIALVTSFLSDPTVRYLGSTLTLAVLTASAGDAFLLTRRISRRVREKFPSTGVRVKLYAVQRAVLPRRFRLPPPRVDRGAKI